MSEELNCDVVVVGGGVAGGGMVNNLARTGLDVVLVEAKDQIPPIKKGDHLSPASVRMLDGLGILNEFWKLDGIKVRRRRIIGPEGRTITDVTFSDFLEEPYNYILSLEHPRIQEALLNGASSHDNVRILRGYKVNELVRDGEGRVRGVQGTTRDNPFRISADVVVGCDGPHSTVRQEAGIEADLQEYPYEFLMLTVSRSPEQADDINIEFWTPSGFLAFFPLGESFVRCPLEASEEAETDWRKTKAEGADKLHAEVMRWLPDQHKELWKDMEIFDDDLHYYKVTRHHASSYVDDGLMLVGDAAHSTSPFLGMGMNLALRDSVFAAQTLREAFETSSFDGRTLKSYEGECREFNQYIIEGSERYSDIATAKIDSDDELESVLDETGLLDSFDRIYEPYT